MTLSLVFGTAYEVHPNDEILDHPNVRPYRMGGDAYVGLDTEDIIHVCDDECATRYLPNHYYRADDFETSQNYVSGLTYGSNHGRTVRTCDRLEFDPGDDPYVLCGECNAELLRDDDAYEAMYGRPIDDEGDNDE